jgi:hypothetical protein
LTYDLSFGSQSPAADSPASITTHFPAGLLADSTLTDAQNGGALCLTNAANGAHAMDASCKVSGVGSTATLGPPVSAALPAAEYLVAPPSAADAAGVLLTVNGTPAAVADVTVRPSDGGLDVTFANVPGPTSTPTPQPQLEALHLLLSDLRLPSNCSAEQMTVDTVSENGDHESTNAPFQATGCSAQGYSPNVTAKVNAFSNGGAEIIASITQGASEAASKALEIDLPSSLSPNLLADAPCVEGTPCQIGTASAITPLAPPIALAHGTVTLGGTITAPTMTVSFPAPYALSFVGQVNLSTGAVTVTGIPDVPITSLSLDITHTSQGYAFNTTCAPSNIGVNFTGQGGQSKTVSAPIVYSGCTQPAPKPGPPTATGSLKGLGSKKPVLNVSVTHGSNAPDIKTVSLVIGSGLKFSKAALHKHCTGHGKKRKCSGKVKAKGLSISGASVKSVKVTGGKLVLTLGAPVGSSAIKVAGPLLTESKGLRKRVKKHKVKTLSVVVKVTDAKGTRTTIPLKLKA